MRNKENQQQMMEIRSNTEVKRIIKANLKMKRNNIMTQMMNLPNPIQAKVTNQTMRIRTNP